MNLSESVLLYADRPAEFVEDLLNVTPQNWQREVLQKIGKDKRSLCSVISGHGCGKSSVASWLMIWFLLTRYPVKIVCTAPSASQLYDALFAEVKRWIKELPSPLRNLLEVKSDRIELASSPTEAFISARTSRAESPEAMAGVHAENVLLIFDEASAIPEQVFVSAYSSMSSHKASVLLIGNGTRNSGYFYETHTRLRDRWWTRRVSCYDSDLVSEDFIEELKIKYGEESNAFRVRVLGEFPLAEDDTLISLHAVEQASKRTVEQPENTPVVWGLDVARYGDDASVLCIRKGRHLIELQSWKKLSLMELSGRVLDLLNTTDEPPDEILVDSIGLGAGVLDRLRELDIPARGVNVSESPAMADRYANLRAELWDLTKSWFTEEVQIPNEDSLIADLTAPRYSFNSSGKMIVESKAETKKRLGRSTDFADSLVLTFASSAAGASGQYRRRSRGRRRNVGGVV
jgi:phage terminase large subunit